MPLQHNIRPNIKYQLLISFLGLFLILVVIANPPKTTMDISWRKPLIGLIFSILCVLGILAVFSPNKCGKILERKKKNDFPDSTVLNMTNESLIVLRGHHPSCGKYFSHVLRIGNRIFCAACAGMMLGGLLALMGALIYFFYEWQIHECRMLIVFLGVIGVILGLFQFKVKGLFRLLVNFGFVVGALLILIGIDVVVHSLFFDLFVVSLIIFWLSTRVAVSKWDHEIICLSCEVRNCDFKAEKNRRN